MRRILLCIAAIALASSLSSCRITPQIIPDEVCEQIEETALVSAQEIASEYGVSIDRAYLKYSENASSRDVAVYYLNLISDSSFDLAPYDAAHFCDKIDCFVLDSAKDIAGWDHSAALIYPRLIDIDGTYDFDSRGNVSLRHGSEYLYQDATWNDIDNDKKIAESNDAALTGNPFLDAPLLKDNIGGKTVRYCEMSKADALDASMDDFAEFVNKRAITGMCNWTSIHFDDGTGICFFGGSADNIGYGTMSSADYSLINQHGAIVPQDNGKYEYLVFDAK